MLVPGHPVKEMISRAHQSAVQKDRTFQHVQKNTAGSDVPRNATEGDACANDNPKTGPPLVLQDRQLRGSDPGRERQAASQNAQHGREVSRRLLLSADTFTNGVERFHAGHGRPRKLSKCF